METDSNYVPRVYVLSLIMSSQRRLRSSQRQARGGMKRAIVTKLVKIEFWSSDVMMVRHKKRAAASSDRITV